VAGNTFGRLFRVTSFGESHGPALGCIIDGCPAGLRLSSDIIDSELARRRPGGGGASTTRKEADQCELLSGIFEGVTLGTPIAIIIRNTAQKSADYDELKDLYRPGHADWCWEAKYGLRDHRGGGRSSARETAARVAAGAVAKRFLTGVKIRAWTAEIAGISAPQFGEAGFDLDMAEENSLRVPCDANSEQIRRMERRIDELRAAGDSAGGIVECRVENMPAALGEPVFDKLDALLAHAMLSLGAVKGIEFGSGFSAAKSTGYANNDAPLPTANGKLGFKTNNAGGVIGGISSGAPLTFRVAFKPVPSISREQQTVNRAGEICRLRIHGRHDVCVCPRAVPVVEAMAALVLADLVLLDRAARSGHCLS
jgi:chorismate synthase